MIQGAVISGAAIPLLALMAALAQDEPSRPAGFPGTAAGAAPRVEIPWNRLYSDEELYAHFARLEAAWPELISHEVIGHSVLNRELRVYTITDPASGAASEKPAMWVDGNVHGNEVQGGEAVLYLAWYLLENAGHVERVSELLERGTFYLLPMVNPDGRASWFRDAHNPHSSRTGVRPVDEDRDGRFDEDGPNDLDGDGHIVQMRKYAPGEGTHRLHPDDPRVLVLVPRNDDGRRGDWLLLGSEGFDDDGDGRVDEDEVGGYDMNRAWPSFWMPEHVQYGAGPYPLFWPETRAIARFLLTHPNVAGVQSFHNSGGMILRGPGAEGFGEYPAADVRVYDELGGEGEKMLPFYRYMVIWKDLYTVFGGFVTWTYEALGIVSFTNELWADEGLSPDERVGTDRAGDLWVNDHLLQEAGFVDWHPLEHPLYGTVEVGGFRKDVGRVPPTFLIEEMLHRNAAFVLEHARQMPLVVAEAPVVTDQGGGLFAVDVVLRNLRAIPTRTARAAEHGIGRPDEVTLAGPGITVLAGGFRTDRFRPEALDLAEHDPARLVHEPGIAGRGELRVRWFVRGSGEARVRFHTEKGRDVEIRVALP